MAEALAPIRIPTYTADRKIGKAVAAEIAYAGVSRTAIAQAIGLDKASFSRSIAGNRQWKASEIIDIASALDIPVSYLMEPRRPNDAPNQGGRPTACNGATILKVPSVAQVAA